MLRHRRARLCCSTPTLILFRSRCSCSPQTATPNVAVAVLESTATCWRFSTSVLLSLTSVLLLLLSPLLHRQVRLWRAELCEHATGTRKIPSGSTLISHRGETRKTLIVINDNESGPLSCSRAECQLPLPRFRFFTGNVPAYPAVGCAGVSEPRLFGYDERPRLQPSHRFPPCRESVS